MAYNDTPLPTDLISDSQPDIRENFQLLEDSQVVDEGSTADGDYIRYENGWQICFIRSLDTSGMSSGEISEREWSFPVNFDIFTPYVVAAPSGRDIDENDNKIDMEGINDWEATDYYSTILQYRWNGDQGISVPYFAALAIGRWK